jgi:galactose mutarotase-like enzyme
MITLKNDQMQVGISTYGAELKSIVCNGVEYMWNSDPSVWDRCAPMCFPICSNLKNNKFTFEGKEYTLEKHGYANSADFEVEKFDDASVTLLHRSNDETLKKYPFEYELRVIYTLSEKSLKVDYAVTNTGKTTMYYNVGAHEGYATPEGISEYAIIFDDDEVLKNYLCCGPLMSEEYEELRCPFGVFQLDEKYYDGKSLIFENFKSRGVTLRHRTGRRAVRIEFPDFPYLLFWHFVGSEFMCIEPWNGLPDVVGSGYEIENKVGIRAVPVGQTEVTSHTITVLK